MKITHLIGNGFDLNIGLETKYIHFLKYYLSLKSDSTIILNFKKDIEKDLKTWSDFELSFGAYSSKLTSIEDFMELFEDIRTHLGEYLKSELNKYSFIIEEPLKGHLLKDLNEPQKYLSQRDQRIFERLQSKYINTTPWTTNVITFNYTEVLDHIIGSDNTYVFKILSKDIRFRIPSVIHLHGTLFERLTFGVNDFSQISSLTLQNNEDVIDTFVKPNFNIALGHLLDEKVQNEIESSDIICLFGVSLGKTDHMWWKMIGEKLKTSIDTYLIFFYKSDRDFPKLSPIEIREKRKTKKMLLEIIGIDVENDAGSVSDRVFVATNTEMLKFSLKKNDFKN